MSDNEWLTILAKIQRSLGIAARIIPDDLLRDIDAALRGAEKRLKQRADKEGRTLYDCRLLQMLAQTTYRLEHASEAKNVPGLVESPTGRLAGSSSPPELQHLVPSTEEARQILSAIRGWIWK